MSTVCHRASNGRYSVSRRNFLAVAVSGLAIAPFANSLLSYEALPKKRIKAVAFDAFAIFDPRPVMALLELMFPGKGAEMGNTWKAKQFEYTWLRTAGRRYKNFWEVTEDALLYASSKTGISLGSAERKKLMDQYLSLTPWPDVLEVLEKLVEKKLRLSFLSNMTGEMLMSCTRHAGIEKFFETIISTDRAKTYKPDPAGYQLGIESLKLKKEEILFVAFAGWDASGAKWFGYPTYWLNRLQSPGEELNALPDGNGKGMSDLISFINDSN